MAVLPRNWTTNARQAWLLQFTMFESHVALSISMWNLDQTFPDPFQVLTELHLAHARGSTTSDPGGLPAASRCSRWWRPWVSLLPLRRSATGSIECRTPSGSRFPATTASSWSCVSPTSRPSRACRSPRGAEICLRWAVCGGRSVRFGLANGD